MRKAAKKTAPDMYQVVTDRIIEQLEKGVMPWRKTWSSYGLAKNYVSGKAYKGINMLMMNFFSPHSIPYYLTFNQAKELGGHVKKGSKTQQVIYFNMIFKDENGNKVSKEAAENREDVKVMKFLKYYNVFNVEDIEGIDFEFDELRLLPNERIERCEKIIQGFPSPPDYVEKDRGRAYYHPLEDYINMPPIEQHDSAEFYYSTYFHELIHSTGHAKRLAREEVVTPNRFGSIPYSEEELVAELGASFLRKIADIDSDPIFQNSASYIHGWLSKLKDDKKLVFKASAEAQKAVDYILGDNFDDTI
jgi:antirestriction protein ArdC